MSRTPKHRVFGYLRVSSDAQVESGLSMEAQRRQIAARKRQLSQQHGLAVAETFEEPAISATRYDLLRRPSGRLLDESLRPGDHLVIAKVDRCFRSMRDCVLTCEGWMRRGVAVHALDVGLDTSTPTGKMLLSMLAVFAEFESRRLGERIRDALLIRRSQGRATNGTPPIGYRKLRSRRVVADAGERRLARRILRMSRTMTWKDVAERLTAEKVRARGRTRWTRFTAARWAASAAAGFPREGVHNRVRGPTRVA